MQEWDNSSSKKLVGGDEEEEVFTIQKFVKCRIQWGIAEIQVMWEGSDEMTWEPEENLRADLGDKMVDKMMMEMRKMQQQKMVSVMMRMGDGTVIHTGCCLTSIALCHLFVRKCHHIVQCQR